MMPELVCEHDKSVAAAAPRSGDRRMSPRFGVDG